MRLYLNIGLEGVVVEGESFTNGIRNPLWFERAARVMSIMRASNFCVNRSVIQRSDSELTVVAEVLWPAGKAAILNDVIHGLACVLNQDCIAVWFPDTCRGRLVGPKAEAWGEFNPEFFVLPNGKRLAELLATA